MMNLLFVCFSVFGLTSFVTTEELTGNVVAVVDGNTFRLTTEEGEGLEIMLFGVDCPEEGQPFAEEAKVLLEKMILRKKITVIIHGKDRWGRRQGAIAYNKTDPREVLLSEGLAWTAERNPMDNFERLKQQAASGRKGIWADDNPTPPWIYRRQQSMLLPKSS